MSVSSLELINLTLFGQIIQQIQNTIIESKYHQLIHDASAAIDQVLRTELLVLLDIRCNAYALQGHFELACIDAQQMIKCAPQLAAGYVRQGAIFSMYGYQKRAIEMYEQGLQHVATISNNGNDNNNTEDQRDVQHSNTEQLNHGKKEARAINNRKVDYFAQLSVEVTNIIIPLLEKNAKAACFSVSKTWREKNFAM